MNPRREFIRKQFDRSASSAYDDHANVQRMMAERLASLVAKSSRKPPGSRPDGASPSPARVLEIGCGTGFLTARLLSLLPDAALTALDLAPAMLETARRRISAAGSARSAERVRFLLADVETWAPGAAASSFDLIASSACFQWLADPGRTIRELRRLLAAGGQLAFATFGPQTFAELHASFAAAYESFGLPPQRHGLSFRSAEQWRRLLAEAGFASIRHERRLYTERHSSVAAFLRSVKAVGASATEATASGGLSSRKLFARMFAEYETRYASEAGIPATYEVLLFRAEAR
ncbi:malonyl-ACP O-methyltransferase BioC [Paenibacillus thermoaerophilus]|uniref:Malonyl-[acyl-carrier protein] O-methyltransferase n=1 Tax=Paenibacillus thermoaerophilus TaxID=1215385 RepID=A0ABW2V890_9BACL|nr:malonyl-ACP O-methyltransferase BioC [Paenibacillus thermoaerophilus]TMV18646.1 malonyl-ACP O-methyltransferase BioC [Paenibacillus thermoaerophilus]